jgi:hypothetical protein
MVLRRGGVEAFEPGVRNIVVPATAGIHTASSHFCDVVDTFRNRNQ